MKRRVIHIDEEKCTGCGLCVHACHEGAIGLVNGKACLMRDDYCDGLGDCLPACPEDAIRFVEREAAAYDEAAVIAEKMRRAKADIHASMPAGGCPGSMAKAIVHEEASGAASNDPTASEIPSRLGNWPIQIKLAPANAPYFQGCDMLVAADCTAFAYGAFHEDFLKGRVCLIGCPKLDGVDYTEKLAEVFTANNVRSVRVARMQVPCCGGIEQAVRRAADAAGANGANIPVQVDVISSDGKIVAVG